MRSKYVERTLSVGESLIYETRLHKIKLLFPVIGLIILGGLCISELIMEVQLSRGSNENYTPVIGVLIFLFVMCVLATISSFLDYWTSEFTVTNKRVVIKVGWIRRKTLELNINKVESASFVQGPLGRMLDYGDIVFTGTGGTKEIFKTVAKPLAFTDAVRKVQESYALQIKPTPTNNNINPKEIIKVRCPKCSALNDETSKFCSICGNVIGKNV